MSGAGSPLIAGRRGVSSPPVLGPMPGDDSKTSGGSNPSSAYVRAAETVAKPAVGSPSP